MNVGEAKEFGKILVEIVKDSESMQNVIKGLLKENQSKADKLNNAELKIKELEKKIILLGGDL